MNLINNFKKYSYFIIGEIEFLVLNQHDQNQNEKNSYSHFIWEKEKLK